MKPWLVRAVKLLQDSLAPVPTELNELDWKLELSPNTKRLTEHLSAFSNYEDGGFLVFGVSNSGKLVGVTKDQCDNIINTLGNIARNGLEPEVQIDHAIESIDGVNILFIFIPQSEQRPVYLRGKDIYHSFIRSASQTQKISTQEANILVSRSRGNSFESEIALSNINPDEIPRLLDFQTYFDLLEKPYPLDLKGHINQFEQEGLIIDKGQTYSITHLGAILFAKDLSKFEKLARKSVRVIVYEGTDKLNTKKEQPGAKGYATGFEGLLNYVLDQLPTNEVIEKTVRKQVKVYPELALRELIANALIHQDFDITGTGPMIEIYSDRIEITNPGIPLVQPDRFLDSPPRSRNEKLASLMRRLNLCEERGSGIDKIFNQIEVFQLPPLKIESFDEHLRVSIYSPRTVSKMTKAERVRACYQHASLKHVIGDPMTNQSLRDRLGIPETNYPLASTIIKDTINEGRIKLLDPDSKSKKHMKYVPYWA